MSRWGGEIDFLYRILNDLYRYLCLSIIFIFINSILFLGMESR